MTAHSVLGVRRMFLARSTRFILWILPAMACGSASVAQDAIIAFHGRLATRRRDSRAALLLRGAPGPEGGRPRHPRRPGGRDPGHERLGQDHFVAADGRP